jgi:hypothetical protein
VRVRFADGAITDVEVVIGEHDERIVEHELSRGHHLRGEVTGPDESLRQWRNGDDPSDTTLLQHHVTFV